MKTVYMFDVDGTLTPHRQKIKPYFKKFFFKKSVKVIESILDKYCNALPSGLFLKNAMKHFA